MKGLRKRLRQAARRRERVDFLYNDTWDIMGARLGDDHVDVLKWAEENNINITDARLLKKNFGWVSHWLRDGSLRGIGVGILRRMLNSTVSESSAMNEADRLLAIAEHIPLEEFYATHQAALKEIETGQVALPMIWDGGVKEWLDSIRGEKVEVIGGFRERCLGEVCMLMEAAGIDHTMNEPLIFGLPQEESDSIWERRAETVSSPEAVPVMDIPILMPA